MDILTYHGQMIYVKTTNHDILLLKVMGKYNNEQSYKVKVLEMNGEMMDEDMVIHNEEITRICILPYEIQQGIELTVNHIPTFNFNDSKNLPSHIEIGEK
ncbi:hypothetical protein H9636_06380 [Ureibacillus sp. Re31]|uniref:Uncharacterized protein n=1 Tax=Ureibacillus galli TaxID=2762222 RepID=A0ABR8XAD0_9BACL|nr:hypothetical protein [Ureibacillus galli]MBD8026282.1 hypothetical protein [Ureibacillus galli]